MPKSDGVRKGQGADVHFGIGQDSGDFGQTAGAIFQKIWRVDRLSWDSPCALELLAFFSLINDTFGLSGRAFKLFRIDQLDLGGDAEKFFNVFHYL